MFLVGTVPALLSMLIFGRLREPDAGRPWPRPATLAAASRLVRTELFGDPRWRRNALVGLGLAFSGVVGLWGIGFFSYRPAAG